LNGFCRYELRTTDVEAAREFYRDLLGDEFWGHGIEIGSLPAHAAARGAPPYWLGHIGVDDVVGAVYRFLDAGATLLGRRTGRDGASQVVDASNSVVRDPSGALVALTSARPNAVDAIDAVGSVAWHLLTARDEAQAFAVYSDLFGWERVETFDLGRDRGRHVTFTWEAGGAAVGSTSNIARLPHVHAQWLFFFRTENLAESLAAVRGLGGLTLPPTETADGDLVAACDDPQGAAFGLYQRRRH